MGIVKTAVVLGAVFAFLPSPPAEQGQGSSFAAYDPGAFAYMAAATEAFADVKGFCERRPQVCSTAGVVAGHVEAKAKYSFKLIYEWANEATADNQHGPLPATLADADPIATSSVAGKAGLPRAASQSTLLIEDLLPEWRRPQPLHKAAKG